MSEQLYRMCPECDGTGYVGQDMCDSCLATDGPMGWIKVELDPKRLAREISKQWSDTGDSVVDCALFVLKKELS